jgi:hypothetical protein
MVKKSTRKLRRHRTVRKHKKLHKLNKLNKTIRQRRRRILRGGAYTDNDATITEIQGLPVKKLNNVVVTGPGFVLDGSDFLQREADKDRQGSEQTD